MVDSLIEIRSVLMLLFLSRRSIRVMTELMCLARCAIVLRVDVSSLLVICPVVLTVLTLWIISVCLFPSLLVSVRERFVWTACIAVVVLVRCESVRVLFVVVLL